MTFLTLIPRLSKKVMEPISFVEHHLLEEMIFDNVRLPGVRLKTVIVRLNRDL